MKNMAILKHNQGSFHQEISSIHPSILKKYNKNVQTVWQFREKDFSLVCVSDLFLWGRREYPDYCGSTVAKLQTI